MFPSPCTCHPPCREVTQLSSYLVELSLVDYASLKFPYSMIAASAVYVAQLSAGVADPFSHTLSRHSGYTLAAIQDCSTHLAGLMRKVRARVGWGCGLWLVGVGCTSALPNKHHPAHHLCALDQTPIRAAPMPVPPLTLTKQLLALLPAGQQQLAGGSAQEGERARWAGWLPAPVE